MFFKTSSCGTIERIELIFLQKVKKVEKDLVVWWKVVYLCHV
jgi:hypothetical protein